MTGPVLTTYLAGGHREAWDGIREGAASAEDARAVAGETMRRVAANVAVVVRGLGGAGWRYADPPARYRRPPPDAGSTVRQVEARLGGPVPLALAACLREVGEVDLRGTHPALSPPLYAFDDLPGYPDLADPLVTPPADWLLSDLAEWDADEERVLKRPYDFGFAPDELHKANISGHTHRVALPDPEPDPVLDGVNGRPGIRLVEYLRTSLAWCGFPGYEFLDRPFPAFLGDLRPALVPL